MRNRGEWPALVAVIGALSACLWAGSLFGLTGGGRSTATSLFTSLTSLATGVVTALAVAWLPIRAARSRLAQTIERLSRDVRRGKAATAEIEELARVMSRMPVSEQVRALRQQFGRTFEEGMGDLELADTRQEATELLEQLLTRGIINQTHHSPGAAGAETTPATTPSGSS